MLESMLEYLVRGKNILNNNIRLKKQTMPEVIFLNMFQSQCKDFLKLLFQWGFFCKLKERSIKLS